MGRPRTWRPQLRRDSLGGMPLILSHWRFRPPALWLALVLVAGRPCFGQQDSLRFSFDLDVPGT